MDTRRGMAFMGVATLSMAFGSVAAAAGGGLMHDKALRPADDFGQEFVKIGRPGNRDADREPRNSPQANHGITPAVVGLGARLYGATLHNNIYDPNYDARECGAIWLAARMWSLATGVADPARPGTNTTVPGWDFCTKFPFVP